MIEKIKIETDFIKLDQLLKFAGVIPTGGEGKELILEGYVFVNGDCETRRGRKIRKGDKVSGDTDPPFEFVVI